MLATHSKPERIRVNEKTAAPFWGGGLFSFDFPLEGNNSRYQPLIPHLIDLALEVIDVIIDEMCEPSLLQQVVADRQTFEAAAGNLLGLAIELQLAVFDLVQRPDAGVDCQLAQFERKYGIEVPALRTWI